MLQLWGSEFQEIKWQAKEHTGDRTETSYPVCTLSEYLKYLIKTFKKKKVSFFIVSLLKQKILFPPKINYVWENFNIL